MTITTLWRSLSTPLGHVMANVPCLHVYSRCSRVSLFRESSPAGLRLGAERIEWRLPRLSA